MKYFIIAGERSGDLHASLLIRYLKRLNPDINIAAWGGDYMKREGADLLKHYRELSIMGFWEVLKNIRRIARLQKECKRQIVDFAPDAVIFVDFPGFNLRIAAYSKRRGFINFYYISPKVWAWNQKRALKIKKVVDRLFCILPFEKEFFKKYDYEVSYVGNPLKEAIAAYSFDQAFLDMRWEKKVIAVLPGSRMQEVVKVGSLLKDVAPLLPEYLFLVAAVDNLPESLYEHIKTENVTIQYNKTYEILKLADAAIVTSGTATLEAALLRAPQVVVYKTSPISYFLAKRLIKVPYISLVNLIAGREVVKELIQDDMTPERVVSELSRIVSDATCRADMLQGYELVDGLIGDSNAPEKAAEEIIAFQRAGTSMPLSAC